eukprot:TRINITY_DN11508_c0_g1_i1.p1 TRINITY_DN11508_c0_g1~~TRINITY_DN11508_c0_g1_i1.p1  ORF type:complete len:382 (+),score=84.49 TRINITY_DN11508_c0_g1_i1:32-1177(+)
MNVVVASSTGLVKTYDTKRKQVVNMWGKATKEDEITSMVWANEDHTQLILGRKNGALTTNLLTSGSVQTKHSLDGAVTGIHVLSNDRILACTENGEIGIFSGDEEIEKFTVNRTIESMLFSGSLESGCQKKAPISTDGRIVISGGEGQLAQMLDLETKQTLWSARNVPLDFLDVEVPIHDRCLSWINPQHTFACVTAHKQFRVYDIRAQRRPTLTVDYGERPFVRLAISPIDPNLAVASDTAANFTSFDLRRKFARIGGFKGVAGALRSIAFHPEEPLVTAVGLDRFLHIFNVNTRASVEKVYLKQRMNVVLVSPLKKQEEEPKKELNSSEEESSEEEEEYEQEIEGVNDILELLPTVETETRKRKQSHGNDTTQQKKRRH